MTARRLLLSTTGLELLRRLVLPEPLQLPPGFRLGAGDADGTARAAALAAAAGPLREAGVVLPGEPPTVHSSVVADLQVLAAPEVAVTVRAARPGLDVTAVLAVSGLLGVGLLRTDTTVVRLSAFPAEELADELAGVVPAPTGERQAGAETVPLDALLPGATAGGQAARLRSASGTLHATVVVGAREGRPGGVVGSAEWAWDGGGWTGLEPLPSLEGRPQVRLVPVGPADLSRWVAGLVGTALLSAREPS